MMRMPSRSPGFRGELKSPRRPTAQSVGYPSRGFLDAHAHHGRDALHMVDVYATTITLRIALDGESPTGRATDELRSEAPVAGPAPHAGGGS